MEKLYKMISPAGVIESHTAANKHDLEMHCGWKLHEPLTEDIVVEVLTPQEVIDNVQHVSAQPPKNKSAKKQPTFKGEKPADDEEED